MADKKKFFAKKSMGQHFLHRTDLAESIVDAMDYELTEGRVLEIGPGPGILTGLLLKKALKLKCVELDLDMIAHLNILYPQLGSDLIQSDVLRLRFDQLFEGKSFNVIGNFPYNISSQIVFLILQNKALVPMMTGMFQKEMATRIIAPPGSKDYGVISVLTQAWYEGAKVIDVPPSAFKPPPKVESTVITLTRKKDPEIIVDEKAFSRVVKQSFSMRRKMLRNNLKPLFDDPKILEDKFYDKRAEQLTLEQYIKLTELFLSQSKTQP